MHLQSMKIPITIKTSYNTAKVPSLVDSGATDNFIHPRTIRQLHLGTSLLDKPKKLFNFDDTQNKAGSVTRYVNLSVTTNQEERQMRFLVSDIGWESLILGYPWLAAFKLCFKWKEGILNLRYLPITCQSVQPTQKQEDQQEQRAIVAQLEEECTNRTIAPSLPYTPSPNLQKWSSRRYTKSMPLCLVKKRRRDFHLLAPGTMRSTSKMEHQTPSIARCTP